MGKRDTFNSLGLAQRKKKAEGEKGGSNGRGIRSMKSRARTRVTGETPTAGLESADAGIPITSKRRKLILDSQKLKRGFGLRGPMATRESPDEGERKSGA